MSLNHRSGGNPLPERLEISDPWISRHFKSRLLQLHNGPAGSTSISTIDKEIYGLPSNPIAFRIGNGGAGYTGVLRLLCETFIAKHGHNIRIAWVANHSRFTQIALLADVVQVAMTYEPDNEDISIREGWAARITKAFNDHFVLVGPTDIQLGVDTIRRALAVIASRGLAFHSRGDGSATWVKEQSLLKAEGIDSSADWFKTYPLSPFEALQRADSEKAFLISDRATFLTAKENGSIPTMRVHIEGGEELWNPCSALVRSSLGDDHLAMEFAKWLGGTHAQTIVQQYGVSWRVSRPLFTKADQEEFEDDKRLVPLAKMLETNTASTSPKRDTLRSKL